MQVDQSFIDALEVKLSSPRLDAYRTYFACKNDAEVIGVYQWNKAIATAFFPLLQATEVTLRNSIHNAAKSKYSGNSEWFRMNRFPKAKKKSEQLYKKRDGSWITPPPTADMVVSQLTFGFWVNMLTGNYDDPVHNNKLWPSLIPVAFPNAHGSQATRAYLHRRFNFIKDFRNRIGHYEPLWKIKDTIDGGGNILRYGPRTPEESISRLQEYIDLILEALKWMSHERYDFLVGIGLEEHVREVCSLDALKHYQGIENNPFSINKLKTELLSKVKNNEAISGFYELKTAPKGLLKGETIFLDIKHLRPPKYLP
ncbi:Hypothetical protein C942_02314 [Photobacterium marinum]|uniref:Abi-like protein n=1 Tax=Photobacterium marinum TaxID=1056511 RepID=L8J753_9GAMM|nr:Abi family protein [Photobacterium marinum]ELR64621.1 Hypothetical protein C942_02314 [Photobacterium marinum]